jgi:hypothetical protein
MAAIQGATSISLGSQPITLTCDGLAPVLFISQGALSLNGNVFIINSASPLATGTYPLIQVAGGTINDSGTHTVTGTAIGSGATGAISTSGGWVNLVVSALPPLVMIQQDGPNLKLSGNGLALGHCVILSSTNLVDPLALWTPVATNQFDGAGAFLWTNTIDNASQRFFRLKLQ